MASFVGRRAETMGLWSLLIPLLFLGVAGDPLTIYTLNSSSAVLGSAALLKCRFNIGGPINLTTLQVQWYFSEQRLAQYDRGKGMFAPRMSISEQELLIGNASLGLENVNLSDQGRYKCVVGYGAEQQQSETTLHVLAAPRLSIPRRSAVTDTASAFPCHVWGFYPKNVTVTWLRDGRVLSDTIRSTPQRNPDGTFNLTLTYTFTPTARDSGSNFSCRVSHSALAQPLQEVFPLDVTGAGAAVSMAITGVCVALLLVIVAVLAIYCWRRRRAPKSAYKGVGEMPPEDPAGSRDMMHGEDRAVMGHDGVSEAREGHENQPLLLTEVQHRRVTQEPEDGARVTGCSDSAGSKVGESLEGGEAVAAAPGTGAPGPNGDSSANTEAGPPGPGTAGDGAGVKASAGLAGKQGGGAAPNFSGGETGQPAAEMVPDTARQEDAPAETGGNVPQPPVLGEISQPQVLVSGEQVTLSCQISGFYPKELRVTWQRRGRGELEFRPLDNSDTHKIVTPDPTASPDRKSYSVKSELCFTPSVCEDDRAEYQCYVEHGTLKEPDTKSTGQLELQGLLRPPVVSEIYKSKSVTEGEETTLSCCVTGHFPGALSVSWFRRDRGGVVDVPLNYSPEYKIDRGAPHTQDGTSFQQETRFSFTPSVQRDQGAEYVCRVGHATLQTPMERRSGELHVAGSSDSAATKAPESEKGRREEEPAAITDPRVMGGGDTTSKGKAGGDGGAETKSVSDLLPKELEGDNAANEGTTTNMLAKEWTGDNAANESATSDKLAKNRMRDNAANKDTTSDTLAKEQTGDPSAEEQTGDNAANESATTDTSPKDQEESNAANEGVTSDAPAKDQERNNAANKGTTTDVLAEEWTGDNAASKGATSNSSAKERMGDKTANDGATSNASAKEPTGDSAVNEDQQQMRTNQQGPTNKLAEVGTGSATPASNVKGDKMVSGAAVSAPPDGGPEPDAEAWATPGGHDAEYGGQVEEAGADGTADAPPGSSE